MSPVRVISFGATVGTKKMMPIFKNISRIWYTLLALQINSGNMWNITVKLSYWCCLTIPSHLSSLPLPLPPSLPSHFSQSQYHGSAYACLAAESFCADVCHSVKCGREAQLKELVERHCCADELGVVWSADQTTGQHRPWSQHNSRWIKIAYAATHIHNTAYLITILARSSLLVRPISAISVHQRSLSP